ncbi:hypothetical protein NKJ70_25955 [Mesorhizobium sp. M0092]
MGVRSCLAVTAGDGPNTRQRHGHPSSAPGLVADQMRAAISRASRRSERGRGRDDRGGRER